MNNSQGFFNSVFKSGLSKNDVASLQEFYSLIRNDDIAKQIGYTEAFNKTLTNCSAKAKRTAVELAKGNTAITDITYSSKAASIGMGLLNAAMNFGIMMAVTGLIELGKYLWKLVPTTEHLKEQLEETAQALADIRSEREGLNGELKTTEERIAELEAKGALSFTDEAELNRLRQENAELERKLILLDDEEKKEEEKYRKKFNKLIGGDRKTSEEGNYFSLYEAGEETTVQGVTSRQGVVISDIEYLKELGRAYHDAEMAADGYFTDARNGYKYSTEDIEKRIDNMSDDITDYQKYLSDLYENGFDYSTADEETKKNVDFVNEMIDTYMVVIGKTDTLWSQVYNRDRFAEAREAIEELAVSGKLSADSLQNLYNQGGNVKEFVDYMLSLDTVDWETILGDNFTDIADEDGIVSLDEALKAMSGDTELASKIMGLFANELNKVEEAAEGAKTAVKSFTDIYDDIKDSFDAISEAEQDMSESGYLSAESVKALEEAGLTDYLSEVEGGYVLVNNAMQDWIESQDAEYQTAIDTAITNAQNLATEQGKVADEYKNSAEEMLNYIKTLKANAIAQGLTAKQDNIDAINNSKKLTDFEKAVRINSIGYQVEKAVGQIYDSTINELEAAISNKNTFDRVTNTINRDDKNKNKGSGSETNETAEKKIANLKHQHEMGLISEATYYKKLEKIRKKYYAGKKKYLDRDRELQEEYHDWEISEAEDGFEDKVEALQEKYANGKITYAELKSKLKKLINTTFKNDKDTKNKYLDELPEYLSDAKEQKEEKNREKFDSSYDKLKYQLENGFITEATYYKKLDALYKKHYGDKTKYLEEYEEYSQEVYDGFKEMYKKDLEADKETWEEKKEAVSEYYDELIEKIQDAHDEEDYEEEQTEKRQTLSDIERQIAELEKDGSEKAKARIAELEEDRKNAEKELEDFEKDHARQEEIERLEKEREAREKEVQDKIDNIDKQLDDLNTNTATIRDLIIDYANKKGVTLDFAHASGTRSSPGGFGRINEKGIEMISAPDGNGNYIPMLPNSYVFSAKATEFLWKLATEHSLPQAMYNSIAKSIKTQSSTPSVNIAQPITITMGDIIIKGNADKQTVADIKKQQENTVRMVLQKIKELQK